MRHVAGYKFHLILVTTLLLPLPTWAIPTITCHCFTDRSYDAVHPAAADPYFLATTQNSFFAVVFTTDKKSVVMKKQRGISSDDLWIAYWVALHSGVSPDTLLQARQNKQAWQDILTSQRLSPKVLGAHYTMARIANSSIAHLAETVVNDLFLQYQLMSDMELSAVRQAGITNQELIIATVIAAKMKLPVTKTYLEVKSRTKTWGALLMEAKIDPKNLQREISLLLKLSPV